MKSITTFRQLKKVYWSDPECFRFAGGRYVPFRKVEIEVVIFLKSPLIKIMVGHMPSPYHKGVLMLPTQFPEPIRFTLRDYVMCKDEKTRALLERRAFREIQKYFVESMNLAPEEKSYLQVFHAKKRSRFLRS